MAQYYIKSNKNIIELVIIVNKAYIDSKEKIVIQRYLDIYSQVNSYLYRLNYFLYNILYLQEGLFNPFLYYIVRRRKPCQTTQVKSIIKLIEFRLFYNLRRKLLYNNKINKSLINKLYIYYIIKDYFIKFRGLSLFIYLVIDNSYLYSRDSR